MIKINKEKEIYPAFQENNIPIVFSSDDNYCPYLGVAIKSIIENSSKKNNYDILILNEEISINYKEKILYLIKNIDNFSIRFINVTKYIKDPSIFFVNSYYSPAAYYRLFIEKICKNYQKIIYLDCDLVVIDDIAELFKINLKNKLLGVTTIPNSLKDKNLIDYINKTLKIPNHSNYFNSGVLLINIPNITKFKLSQKAINSLKEIKTPRFVDQDILNSVCFNRTKFINQKYNYHVGFDKKNGEEVVIHYVINKPWKNPKIQFSEVFWEYARLTPFYEEIIYTNAINVSQEEKNNHILNSKSWKLTKPLRFLFSKIRKIKNTKYSVLV